MTTETNRALVAREPDLPPKQARKRGPAIREPIPASQVDVALLDINDVKALTRMGRSWIYDSMSKNEFPAPVIRETRCARWSLANVRAWLIGRTAAVTDDGRALDVNGRQAVHASAAARANRQPTAETAT